VWWGTGIRARWGTRAHTWMAAWRGRGRRDWRGRTLLSGLVYSLLSGLNRIVTLAWSGSDGSWYDNRMALRCVRRSGRCHISHLIGSIDMSAAATKAATHQAPGRSNGLALHLAICMCGRTDGRPEHRRLPQPEMMGWGRLMRSRHFKSSILHAPRSLPALACCFLCWVRLASTSL